MRIIPKVNHQFSFTLDQADGSVRAHEGKDLVAVLRLDVKGRLFHDYMVKPSSLAEVLLIAEARSAFRRMASLGFWRY